MAGLGNLSALMSGFAVDSYYVRCVFATLLIRPAEAAPRKEMGGLRCWRFPSYWKGEAVRSFAGVVEVSPTLFPVAVLSAQVEDCFSAFWHAWQDNK